MTDSVPQPQDSDEELDLPSSFALSDQGWEAVDYVEPGPDWRISDDGMYESPDGTLRTKVANDPAEWTDRS